jgi:hypothetical protein
MWNNPQSVAGAFLDNSGGFTFSREGAALRPSRVVTVTIAGTSTDVTGCNWQQWGERALAALTFDPNAFTFK